MRYTVSHPFSDIFKAAEKVDMAFRKSERHSCCDEFPVNMDLVEDKDSFRIYVELPGMSREEINISVENRELVISGEKKGKGKESDRVIFSERYFGNFKRSFKLSEKSDSEKISAEFKNGLLVVILPHREEIKPKEIKVSIN